MRSERVSLGHCFYRSIASLINSGLSYAIGQGKADFYAVRSTSIFFRVLRSTQWLSSRSYSLSRRLSSKLSSPILNHLDMYLITATPALGSEWSSVKRERYVVLIIFTVENADSHRQVQQKNDVI
ncbi:hypothetical protein TNCV_4325241 [Trichonephila clavipes]|nr:hypothetical protein TNCV_4325241 [Trichonephila clavipes]